jgi:organic radical activating enzyme
MYCLDRLDIMIAYSCNLSCKGCISLSDRVRSGIEPFENIFDQLNQWQSRISPNVTAVFGGEPCLHPRLIEICQQIRFAWPNTIIRLITNGYLLDNFDAEAWFNLGPIEIQVSVHRKDHEHILNKKIKNILEKRNQWTMSIHAKHDDHKQIQWQHQTVSIYKSIFKDFVVPYYQNNLKILPWNSDPLESHKICGSPSTPILYKGKLYKCPAVANVIDITGKNWFDYRAAEVTDDLTDFISYIGKPEKVCGQCPSRSQAVIIDHFDKKNVIVRQKNIS